MQLGNKKFHIIQCLFDVFVGMTPGQFYFLHNIVM